jgi:hypothetical protein
VNLKGYGSFDHAKVGWHLAEDFASGVVSLGVDLSVSSKSTQVRSVYVYLPVVVVVSLSFKL